jgi:hypothetical protein
MSGGNATGHRIDAYQQLRSRLAPKGAVGAYDLAAKRQYNYFLGAGDASQIRFDLRPLLSGPMSYH